MIRRDNRDGTEDLFLDKEDQARVNVRDLARREAMFREGVHVYPTSDLRPHVVDDFHPQANPCWCFYQVEWVEGLDRKQRPVVIHCRMNN